MPYITRKDLAPFRSWYETNVGHVDEVSHVFGVASHEKFYRDMEGWCFWIDSLIPDWFPLNYIQDGLMGIVKALYDMNAGHHYNLGVDKGRKIVGAVNDAITWAQNKITTAVEDMRNKIDTEIIAPIRNKINTEIKPLLDDAQAKIGDIQNKVNGFNTDINTMKSNISTSEGSIKAFDGKLGSFDSKLKSLGDQADTLQSQFKDAQAKLTQYKSLIDDLTRRVQNLEGKQPYGLDFLKNLGV